MGVCTCVFGKSVIKQVLMILFNQQRTMMMVVIHRGWTLNGDGRSYFWLINYNCIFYYIKLYRISEKCSNTYYTEKILEVISINIFFSLTNYRRKTLANYGARRSVTDGSVGYVPSTKHEQIYVSKNLLFERNEWIN